MRAWMRRSERTLVLIAVVMAGGAMGGCGAGTDFRRVATPAVHSGVSSILNGLVDGLFATIELESSGDDSGGNNTTTTTP